MKPPFLTLQLLCLTLAIEPPPQSTLPALPQSTLPPLAQCTLPPAPPVLPAGCVEYHSDSFTQEIAVTNGYDRITPAPIARLESKWHAPGGLAGITGWKSRKYRLIPKGKEVQVWVGDIQVLNSFGYYQPNRGLLRSYPDGTEFHDVLLNEAGEVFEHRVRKKSRGRWSSSVDYVNEDARPKGYHGLGQSCASCHNEAGSGGYGTGLVPGGDTVLSDPLPWHLLRQAEIAPVRPSVQQPTFVPSQSFRGPPVRFSSGSC